MADEKAKPNLFQKAASWAEDVVEWVEATFGDPELSREIRADLGLDVAGNPTPGAVSDQQRAKIQDFVAKADVDEQALGLVVAEVVALVQTGMTFADAVKSGGVDAGDVFWLLFKVWAADSLRARNPAAYGLVSLAGLVTEDDEALNALDLAPIGRFLQGEVSADTTEVIDRLSFLVGTTVVMLDQLTKLVGGVIEAAYGWDPEPSDAPESALVAARTLSVEFLIPGSPANPVLTLVGVPAEHGGPGIVLSIGALLEISHDTERTRYTFSAGANGAFAVYLGKGSPRAMSGLTPSFALRTEPVPGLNAPALLLGTSSGTRLEIGALAYGIEVGADHAGFRLAVRKGKLVLALGQGDGFLRNLPAGAVEVPFDLGLLADTKNGVRFEGGTGLKVNLPVAASLFGVFTVQYIQLELVIGDEVLLELRGGFSCKLGPFSASVDQLGMGTDFTKLARGEPFDQIVSFLPPKGIGLRLDAGVVKGGGYLFIDAQRGEYAGALELTIAGVFSLKAICLITTKRPDGSEGWSLLILIFGQFSVHIAFGIFLTGIGGLIGLHHRVDLDALQSGMKTGALDDILFPQNPVADAPRIITRYRQLFPIEPDSLLLGPMLELAFSKPPIVYVRLGLLFEVRNALGGDKPLALTKVVLLGQLLAQLPPRDTGAPAILKLLVDVVGFYDAQEKFLMIRARLRDSFVGIEGFAQLNLSGELLLAMRFGDDPSFVLSAGGFHPAFKDLPTGVPGNLERLAVSFGIGPIQMRCENYFAITSNSVQGGFKVSITAKLGPASIEGWLSFDALLYLAPVFHFLVGLGFHVAVKAFGSTLCSVDVSMSLEGPGEWHAVGSFSFSILFWDVSVGFDEKWGSAPAVDAGTTSAASALVAELQDPTRMLPGPPVGGASLVTLATVEGETLPLAHPLGQLSIRQKLIPLEVQIDRLGTKKLTEGAVSFAIAQVKVGGRDTTAVEKPSDHFARGQFMELSESEKLAGKSFERFPCGVTVGTSSYTVPSDGGLVTASYEEKILEPEPAIARFPWALIALGDGPRALPTDLLDLHVSLGAAARSARATAATLTSGGPGVASVRSEAPLVLADAATLQPTAELVPEVAASSAVAHQQAAATGAVVVDAYELVGV